VTEVTVFDWAGGKPTHTFKGHASTVSALAFSKGGRMLATGSHDSTVLLWDVSKEQ
jgi:WD40 repeat protein